MVLPPKTSVCPSNLLFVILNSSDSYPWHGCTGVTQNEQERYTTMGMHALELELESSDSAYDEEEEEIGLIANNGRSFGSRAAPIEPKNPTNSRRGSRRWKVFAILAFASLMVFHWTPNIKPDSENKYKQKHDGNLHYACPAQVDNPENSDSNLKKWYDEASQQILTNMTEFMGIFRKSEYDNWGHTFEQVKSGMYDWKSTRFLELQDNSTIYESACGIGMNLFMTLEILEGKGIKNLVVYGNEYVPESVDIATTMFNKGMMPGSARLGTICQADSTHLEFVPPNSFDLVYTGYIMPIINPLQLDMPAKDKDRKYIELCEAKDEEGMKQNRLAQQRQNDWYGHWVAEMVKIAKPGAPVIIEQVSYPLCQAYFDWGGVDQSFWRRGRKKYGWDILPGSIEFEEDKIYRQRYHVFMRKNKATGNSTGSV